MYQQYRLQLDETDTTERLCDNVMATNGFSSMYDDHGDGNESLTDQMKMQWQLEQDTLKKRLILDDTEPWELLRVTVENAEEHPDVRPVQYIAGVDISFVKGDTVNACAALVVVELPGFEVVYEDLSMVKLTAPYIPGFLAFREAEFLVEKVHRLRHERPDLSPQAILVDGNGILHVKGFGLACHIGLQLDIPSVGVAKTLYHMDGLENNAAHKEKIQTLLKKGGDSFELIGDSGEVYGIALRSCDKTTNPVYVSPGHKISLQSAVWLAQLCSQYRIPEPVRQADIKSREYLREKWKTIPVDEPVDTD